MRIKIIFILMLAIVNKIFAQPSDSQVRKDLMSKGVLKIELSKKAGHKYLHTSDLVWYWDKGFKVWRNANIPEYTNAKMVIGGVARYNINGSSYKFSRTLTTYNEYEGIPKPSEKELTTIVKNNISGLLSGSNTSGIVGNLQSLDVVKSEPEKWPRPESVIKRYKTTYYYVKNYTEVALKEEVIDVRFYRKSISAPWDKNIVPTRVNMKELSTKKHTKEEIDEMPRLRVLLAQNKAKNQLGHLPEISIPEVDNFAQLVLFIHNRLREGNANEIEALFRKILSNAYFEDQERIVLHPRGKELIERIKIQAYSGSKGATYKDQFCKDPHVDRRSSANRYYLNGVLKGSISKPLGIIAEGQLSGGTYINGVKQGQSWKITSFKIWVRKDKEARDLINSYSDRKLLCPKD